MDACSRFFHILFFLVTLLTEGGETSSTTTDAGANATTAGDCVNKIDNCYHYPRHVICKGIYIPWATDRCSRYCGFCKATGTEKPCVDAIPNCVEFDPCHDPSFFIWVNENCRKFCNVCGGTPQGTTVAVTGVTQTTGTTESGRTTVIVHPTTVIVHPTTVIVHTTTAPHVTATKAPPSCSNSVSFCHLYSKAACDDMTWAINFCPHFCNVCQYVAVTSPVTAPPSTSMTGQTDTSRDSVVTSVTSSSPSSNKPGCVNQLASCNNYSKSACQDKQWAHTYCAAFCGVCG